jgi:hypothetical protein
MKPSVEQQIEHTFHHLVTPRRSHSFWGFVAAALLATFFLWLKHDDWMSKPNSIMLGNSPDGFKNYMTAAWHVERDETLTHYGGMNYPYGEHTLFTDNQPILSSAMQWWHRNVSSLTGETVGVMNTFQWLSVVFGIGILFILLHKLHLPWWYSVLVALGMGFLSPQQNRFDGHFGLSHIWIFPMLLLLLCRYEERFSRRYQSLLIGILVFVAAQFHFYYFGLAALFLTLYTAYMSLTDFKWSNIRARFSHWLVMVILPFAALNIWIRWSDYAVDRPASPYGFTRYIGYWEGVLLPYEYFPIYKWIDQNIVHIRRVDGETQAFAGLVVLGFTIWAIRRGFKFFPKTWDTAAYHRVHKRYLAGIFTAAMVLLVFSCGFPYAIKGLGWMVDYFGPLRQFRGLGRFTWAYFYVANIVAFYIIWNYSKNFTGLKDGRYPWLRQVIRYAPLLVLLFDAWTYQRLRPMQTEPNIANKAIATAAPEHWLNKVDFKPYQALLPLPYYNVGSENIWLDFNPYEIFKKTQLTALHTGLPDMGVNMSRTARGEMLKSVQMMFHPCQPPVLVQDLPNNKPIALLIEPGRFDDVKNRYRHLLLKATEVYNGPELRIWSLFPDSLRAAQREIAAEVLRESQNDKLIPLKEGWKGSIADPNLQVLSFDDKKAAQTFQGAGALEGIMSDTAWIWKAPLPKGRYKISLWVYADSDMGMTHEIKMVENRIADGQEIHFQHEGMRFYLQGIMDKWALFEMPFEVYGSGETVMNIFTHKKDVHVPFTLDEVLIKSYDGDVYKQSGRKVARNNLWYELE